jgi:hypothetical protein
MSLPTGSPMISALRFAKKNSDSFVASAASSIATGWRERVPGRDLHPLKSGAFSRRTVTPITAYFHGRLLCYRINALPTRRFEGG